MSLELYNTTNKVKVVPKYRYNGKYTLQPFGFVDIEDYTAEFFAPYAKIGVVVRAKCLKEVDTRAVAPEKVEEPAEEIKKEVKEEVKTEIPALDSDIKLDEKVESGTGEGKIEIEEKTDEVLEPVVEDNEKVDDNNDSNPFSREILQDKTMKDLREIAEKLKIDVSDIRRKDPLIDAILNSSK